MKFRFIFCFVLFLIVGAFAASPTMVIGVVLEAESDLPVKDVAVTYKSGKPIGTTDSRGRFEFSVDSKNATLVFKKDGFDSVFVELQDYADLMDMVVTLSTNVTNLGASTIIGDGEPIKWDVERTIQIDKLEDAAGMRFDLTEHLSQMPGISGQKDFSSALYYQGSRASDVAYHLGRLRIPNMRHLDVGFPNNLSVINPHTLSGIEVHDHYGQGPLGQGLATSIQFIPEQTSGEWGLRGSATISQREVLLDAPFFFWDSFRFAFRTLDAGILKILGEKFYTTFKRSDEKSSDDKVKSSDPFDLSAFDIYAQLNGSDSLGNATWALRTLYSSDEYRIRQDTTNSYSRTNSIDIVEGSQRYLVVGAEYASKFGASFHAGLVRESLSDSLRDTTGFRKETSKRIEDADRTFIDGYNQTHTTLSVGADKDFHADIFGADLRGAVLYEHHFVERRFPITGGEESSKYQTGILSGAATLDWKNDYSQYMISVGAVADAADHNARPTASFDMERNLSKKDSAYWRLFGNAAYRADWKHYFDDGDLTGRLESGTSLKLGAGYRSKYLVAQLAGFGRFYADPLLPLPKAFANYKDVTPIDFAWVSGATGSVEWKTSHHFSMAMNASSVYGEYELKGGKSLPWEANSRLDVVSHFRFYPRKDSIVSLILTHHAAWHRPLYYYAIKPALNKGGTRELKDYNQFTDLYRTDIRVNLDLTKSKFFFKHARFYLEVDNIFSKLDVGALKFLGSRNWRERSWVARDNDKNTGNGYDLVPFIAKGMGLNIDFGVEVQLGI